MISVWLYGNSTEHRHEAIICVLGSVTDGINLGSCFTYFALSLLVGGMGIIVPSSQVCGKWEDAHLSSALGS